jgi:hypothetical protein
VALPMRTWEGRDMARGDRPSTAAIFTRRGAALLVLALAVAVLPSAGGCKRNPRVVLVKGKVLYNGEPLPFGSVMFQPDKGQPAVGDLAADGTFTLSSYGPNDGAVPGKHSVSISCYEGHRPGKASGGDSLGKLLIPLKYTRFGSSGLTAEVQDTAGKEPQEIVLELSGPEVAFN